MEIRLIKIVEQVFFIQIESASDKDRKYIIKLNTNTTEVSTNHVYTGERAEKPQGVSHNLYKFRHWRHRLPTTNRSHTGVARESKQVYVRIR